MKKSGIQTVVLATHLVACGSEASTLVDTTTGSTTTGTTSGTTADVASSDSTTDAGPTIDEDHCQQFATESDCNAAVDPTATVQCYFFDNLSIGSALVDTPEGLRCENEMADAWLPSCHAVHYVPAACELSPPAEGIDQCGDFAAELFWYWYPEQPGRTFGYELPCHLRPPGAEVCWENPVPECWCRCPPGICSGPWCVGDESTGEGTGTGTE